MTTKSIPLIEPARGFAVVFVYGQEFYDLQEYTFLELGYGSNTPLDARDSVISKPKHEWIVATFQVRVGKRVKLSANTIKESLGIYNSRWREYQLKAYYREDLEALAAALSMIKVHGNARDLFRFFHESFPHDNKYIGTLVKNLTR